MTVGQRIKQAREKRGLTQRHVAQQAAMNVALFQSYEYGKRQPGEEQLKKIADAIGVPPESLRPPKIETETERSENSDTLWYKVLSKALLTQFDCDIESEEFSNQNCLVLAQKLINNPVSDAFTFLTSSFGAAGGDE